MKARAATKVIGITTIATSTIPWMTLKKRFAARFVNPAKSNPTGAPDACIITQDVLLLPDESVTLIVVL